MKAVFLCLTLVLFASCRTVEVPLGGVMVGRPHAMGSQVGVRATVGVVEEPKVQGVVEEVTDSEGKVINPLASESTVNSKASIPLAELGVSVARYVELGVSSNRGLTAMTDLYHGSIWTTSLSFASMRNSVQIKKDEKKDTSEQTESKTLSSPDTISGSANNINVTWLNSMNIGDHTWTEASLYSGIGINRFAVEISDEDTKVTKNQTQLAPSILAGVQVKLAIFELSAEAAAIKIRERNAKSKVIPLGLVSATLRFDSF